MEAASKSTLPRSPERSPEAPGGSQRAFPFPGAQLGLDGYSYAPHIEPRSGEPLLGPETPSFAHGGFGRVSGAAWDPPSPLRGQLELDLADTEAIPQLDLYTRLRAAWDSVALGSRQSKCGRCRRKGGDATGYRDERGVWHWPTYACRTYACPRCGQKRARKDAAALHVAIERHLASGAGLLCPDVWMLTLTLPHVASDGTSTTVARLYDAHEAFKRSSAWRRFVDEWALVGMGVRVLDVTFGGHHGAHPHFHIALFPAHARVCNPNPVVPRKKRKPADEKELAGAIEATIAHAIDSTTPRALSSMSQYARQLVLDGISQPLFAAWRDACRAAGVTRPVMGSSVKLSPAENAANYFTAWGLADEVAGTPSKACSHLRLLDAVAQGNEAARREYAAFVAAMSVGGKQGRGRQWVTGLGDLLFKLRVTGDDCVAYVQEQMRKREVEEGPREVFRQLSVVVPASLWPAALTLGFPTVHRLCEAADVEGRDVQRALLDALHTERELRASKLASGVDPPDGS